MGLEGNAGNHHSALQRLILLPKKVGCGVLVVIWFAALSLPFAMFWLGMGQNITIPRPGSPIADYPLLEIRLIMEIENRGLQIKRTYPFEQTDSRICYQTVVNYLLWQADSAGDPATGYCECYSYDPSEQRWSQVQDTVVTCPS
jgi:hypothetical protein